MNIIQRLQAPTPDVFKKIRRIGLLLTAISGALLAAPAVLPTFLITTATYIGVVGSLATVISQAMTEEDAQKR